MFNMSHTIKKLSFGQEYPGIINPLDGHKAVDDSTQQGTLATVGCHGNHTFLPQVE